MEVEEKTDFPQQPAEAPPKKRRSVLRGIAFVVLFILLAAGAVALGYYGYIYYMDHIRQETDDAGLYLWEGEYVDTVGYQTSMSVEKSSRKGFYDITVCMGEENSSDLIFWEFVAYYDKESNTLVYSEASREDWIHPEAADGEEAGELVIEKVYVNGTGHLEVNRGLVTWKDDKEDFGKGMVFEKSSAK